MTKKEALDQARELLRGFRRGRSLCGSPSVLAEAIADEIRQAFDAGYQSAMKDGGEYDD